MYGISQLTILLLEEIAMLTTDSVSEYLRPRIRCDRCIWKVRLPSGGAHTAVTLIDIWLAPRGTLTNFLWSLPGTNERPRKRAVVSGAGMTGSATVTGSRKQTCSSRVADVISQFTPTSLRPTPLCDTTVEQRTSPSSLLRPRISE